MNSNDQGKKYYSVLTRAEIREKMMKQVAHISELFSLSLSDATVVLIRLRWDSFKVQELLGDDNQKFLSEIGLVGSPSVDFEVAGEGDNLVSTPCCSHKFTRECWRDYLRESLVKSRNKKKEKDEEVVLLSCLSPDCVASVGPSTIEKLEEPAKEVYGRYLLESFMESKRDSIKWCPKPDCNYAAIVRIDDPSEDFGVVCLCGHIFCWSCQLESHRPVTCNNASLWLNELLYKSRTLAGIAERIKGCPKCYQFVENHNGVWKCIPCNASSPSNELALITHLALWEASHAEMEKSKRDLEAKLSTRLTFADCGLGEQDMVALREAWMLIVQCILVLKWSCVFGYFITDYHSAKKVYLEYQVEIATANLSIHKKTLDDVTERVISGGDVIAFRQILGDTRTRTGNYFQSFAKSVEDGLRDIEVTAYEDGTNDDYWFCDRCTYKNYSFERQCRVCVGPCESPRHGQGETNPWEKRNSSGLAITIPLRFCLSLLPKLPDHHCLPPSSLRKDMNSDGQGHYSFYTRGEIREKMMKEVTGSEEDNLIESFMESNNETFKWCPAPDCHYAIERRHEDPSSSEDDFGVVCLCGHRFCWSCQLEPHRPVTCNNASLWLNELLYNKSRTLARTTQCPECHTPVENHDGVWKCIQCKASSPSNDSALISHLALWDACHEEIQASKRDLQAIGLDMKALREAWMIIVQYRRVLKWTCAFGYFITDYDSAEKEYLTHLRKDATAHLLKHKETLNEVKERVTSGGDITVFTQILVDTTTTTHNYFDFFLKTLEYGFTDVKVDDA